MLGAARIHTRRALANPQAPIIALALILAVSLIGRALYLGAPCAKPCRTRTDHTLIFDESYYVNAARVIAGIKPPTGVPYATAPLRKDPNAEHPQLAKLIIAGTIELFGDNPWGWRFGSIVFGLLALVAIYALVRAARGSPWLATGTAAVMAVDNLALIHGRIATLDIYVLALVLIAAALYLRGWMVPAGLALGLAACMKLVGLAVVPAFVLLELLRAAWARGTPPRFWRVLLGRGLRLGLMLVVAAATLLLGVWVLDLLVPAYDPGTHITYAGSPFTHIHHMLSYAAQLKATPHATGISSTPWEWLVDQKPISYARTAVNSLSGGKIVASRAVFDARGEVTPAIMFVALPALGAAIGAAWAERDELAAIGAAWCLGTFAIFVIQSDVFNRISYLYYMLLVMPGIYLVAARLFSPRRVPRLATVGWALILVYSCLDLYPVRTLSGR